VGTVSVLSTFMDIETSHPATVCTVILKKVEQLSHVGSECNFCTAVVLIGTARYIKMFQQINVVV